MRYGVASLALTLGQLRQMGLIRVFLGVEAASTRGLACLGREHSREEASAVLSLCRRLGISAQYTIRMFHPDATLESCREDLDFMEQHAELVPLFVAFLAVHRVSSGEDNDTRLDARDTRLDARRPRDPWPSLCRLHGNLTGSAA